MSWKSGETVMLYRLLRMPDKTKTRPMSPETQKKTPFKLSQPHITATCIIKVWIRLELDKNE